MPRCRTPGRPGWPGWRSRHRDGAPDWETRFPGQRPARPGAGETALAQQRFWSAAAAFLTGRPRTAPHYRPGHGPIVCALSQTIWPGLTPGDRINDLAVSMAR